MQVLWIIAPMRRTSIHLPPELRKRADRRARQLGISFGELVRCALAAFLDEAQEPGARDVFFADRAVFFGEVPSRAATHHDENLYPSDGR